MITRSLITRSLIRRGLSVPKPCSLAHSRHGDLFVSLLPSGLCKPLDHALVQAPLRRVTTPRRLVPRRHDMHAAHKVAAKVMHRSLSRLHRRAGHPPDCHRSTRLKERSPRRRALRLQPKHQLARIRAAHGLAPARPLRAPLRQHVELALRGALNLTAEVGVDGSDAAVPSSTEAPAMQPSDAHKNQGPGPETSCRQQPWFRRRE